MANAAPRPLLPRIEPAASKDVDKAEASPATRKHVGLACMACKRRKTKCDGTTPCSMCTRKATECVYEAAQSRLESLRMQNEDYKKRNDQYKTILSFLRSGTIEESQEILSRLRNGPSIEAVVEHIEHASLLASQLNQTSSHESAESGSNPKGKGKIKRKFDEASEDDDEELGGRSPPSPSTATSYNHSSSLFDASVGLMRGFRGTHYVPDRLSVASLLSDPPPAAGHTLAKGWSSVTDNHALVTDLISTWFTNYQPFLQVCEPELFYKALAAGPNTKSEYCSPLLVNSIAASACHVAEHIQGKTTPWDDNFIGRMFLSEALSLWRQEDGKESLTNMQAATILCDIMSHNGEDKEGTSFLLAACQNARSLGLLRDKASWDDRPKDGKVAIGWERSRAYAVWALFNYQGATCYSLQRPPLIRRPPSVDIPVHEDDKDTNKIFFRALCKLSIIINELCLHHFAEDEERFAGFATSVEKTEEMYQRLLAFQDSLHPAITAEPDGHPTTLLLQMQIRYIIVSLFSPYADSHRLSIGQRFYKQRASSESRIALMALRQLLNLWSYCFGFGKCPYYLSHILIFDGLTALDELKEAQSRNVLAPTDAYTGLMGSIVALGELAQRFVVCEANLKALEMKSDEIGVNLSLRAQQALRVVTQPGWLKKAQLHFRSNIPMFLAAATAAVDRPDSLRLDHMLKAWSLSDDYHGGGGDGGVDGEMVDGDGAGFASS